MTRTVDWTPERVADLRELMSTGVSYRTATHTLSARWAVRLNVSLVRQACQRFDIPSHATVASGLAEQFAPYRSEWRLTGDWMVCADLHLPFVDVGLAGQMVQTAQRRKVRNLIVVGDIFYNQALGPFAAVVPEPDEETTCALASAVMGEWLEWFKDVRMLCGNHDLRLAKQLSGALRARDVLAALHSRLGADERVQWSILGYTTIDTPAGEWRVTHPRNYSINALFVAARLATRCRTHIITAHEHRTAIGFDPSGQSIIVNVGCMADPAKLAYVMLTDTTRPVMTQSYAAIVDGRVTLYSPHAAWGMG